MNTSYSHVEYWRLNRVAKWLICVSIAFLSACAFLTGILKTHVELTLEPTAARNNLSSGSEISVEFHSLSDRFIAAPDWARNGLKFSIGSPKNLASSRLQWNGEVDNSSALTLVAGPNAGVVRIIANGKVTELDLYDPFGKTFYIKPLSLVPLMDMVGPEIFPSAGVFLTTLLICLLAWTVCFDSVYRAERSSLREGYLPRLDHLRFAAATLVMLYHIFHDYVTAAHRSANPLMALIDEGHTGVALFMVISGFIFGQIGRGKLINYREFLRARAARILPLYLFAIFVVVSTRRWEYKPLDILLLTIPVINFYSLVALPFFGQLWTVAVEFQFYLVFPHINKFIKEHGARYLLGLLSLFVIVKACYFGINNGNARDFAYWTILGRMDQFLVGIAAAYLYEKRLRVLASYAGFPISIAVLFLLVSIFDRFGGFTGTSLSPVWIVWPAIEAATWALVVVTYLSWRVQIPSVCAAVVARLGSLSFSVYVMQYVSASQVQRFIGIWPVTDSWTTNVLLSGVAFALPAVLLLSCLTYLFIERPFLARKSNYIRQ